MATLEEQTRSEIIQKIFSNPGFRVQAAHGKYGEYNENPEAIALIDGIIANQFTYLLSKTDVAFFS